MSALYEFCGFVLDPARRLVTCRGEAIPLAPKTFDLLLLLLESHGRALPKAELMRALWTDTFVEEANLSFQISALRKALGQEGAKWIETLPKYGYRFGDGVVQRTLPDQPEASATVGEPPKVVSGQTGESRRLTNRRWYLVSATAAVGAVLAIGVGLWLQRTEYFWRSPIDGARFQTITDLDGTEQAAAVSRDGRFVAFLSDREGQMDVWVTQVGSGQFHNLTRGGAKDLLNHELRSPGFSPDGSLVTFWTRKSDSSRGRGISVWAVPTLGGRPQPYLEDVAEFDWSRDGSRLVYHTAGPGDPMFVSDGSPRPGGRPIFTAPAGLHCHFPLWAPDMAFIYFVQGSFPDKLSLWRIAPAGGTPERITSSIGRVTHPVLLSRRALMYLASDPDGSGPWLYGMDVERRIPHRLTSSLDRYTSLAASADGHRLVVTRASPKRTLWRLRIAESPAEVSAAAESR